jgi:hypothetical protein
MYWPKISPFRLWIIGFAMMIFFYGLSAAILVIWDEQPILNSIILVPCLFLLLGTLGIAVQMMGLGRFATHLERSWCWAIAGLNPVLSLLAFFYLWLLSRKMN